MASPITLVHEPGAQPTSELHSLAVAPLSVVPDRQAEGIGGSLMRHLIATARDERVDVLFLLGHPAYYPRFGFAPTHIGNEYGATDAFMSLELTAGSLEPVRAVARYVATFQDIGV